MTPNQQLLASCVAIAGGQSALARAANSHIAAGTRKLTQSDIHKWLTKRREPCPPAIYVRAIEAAVKGIVTRYQMRPDVFGHGPDEERRSAA